MRHSRFEPKGGASLKQQSRRKNGEGIVNKRGKAKKKTESEKALKKALEACFRNGCSVAEVEQIVFKSVENLKS